MILHFFQKLKSLQFFAFNYLLIVVTTTIQLLFQLQYNFYNYMLTFFRLNRSFSIFNSLKPTLKQISPRFPSSPCKLAQILQTSESRIRNQMINPKSQIIQKQQAQLISLMNGYKISSSKTEQRKRSPIITIMGHVDHGKTTLLDFLRKSNIAQNQFGGITQKIGAFHVYYKDQKITVIDTPGHEAFNNMRLRGATVTDIIVLVISATEGVKKQTLQVINLAKKSNIPIVIAINKIDLPEAQPEMVQKQLMEQNLSLEPYGGEISVVHISGKTGKNVDLLIELILQQAQVSKFSASYSEPVQASVIEAYTNNNDMNTVTLVVQKGTIRAGTILVANDIYCKVKTIYDDRMNTLGEAYPGDAVSIIGFKQLPASGDIVFEVDSEKKAKHIVQKKIQEQKSKQVREILTGNSSKVKINSRKQRRLFYRGFSGLWLNKFKEIEDKLKGEIQALTTQQKTPDSAKGQLLQKKKKQALTTQQKTPDSAKGQLLQKKKKQLAEHLNYVQQYLYEVGNKSNSLNLIIKSSDRGSQQTVLKQLQKIKQKVYKDINIQINILKSQIGQVTQNQVKDCKIFGGIIVCFGVGIKSQVTKLVKQLKVPIKIHKLLHTFLEDINQMCVNKTKQDQINLKLKGTGKVAEVFKVSTGKKQYKIAAGVKIQDGRICKKYKYKVIRNGKQITKLLTIQSMKNFKKQVTQLKKGDECTLLFTESFEFEKGDLIKAFE